MRGNKYIAFAFITGIAYRLLAGLQGIDTIDMGFCNTFFQNIFSHPDAMVFYFNYYLTGLAGGIWNAVAGSAGLLGFRVLETLTMASAIYLIYRAFEEYLPSAGIAAAAILLSFLFPSFVLTFHYNTLSFLLMAASVYCFSRYVKTNDMPWLAAAGIFTGICFFARIVNGTLLALVLVPAVYGLMQSSLRKCLTRAMVFLGGIAAGCLLVLSTMAAIEHLTYFEAGLQEAFGTFNSNDTSHASANLFQVYLKSYVNIGIQVLALSAIAFAYQHTGRLNPRLRLYARLIITVGLFVLIGTSQPYLSAVAACTLLCLVLWLNQQTAVREKILILYAAGCTYLFPFGSDIGIPGIFHWCAGMMIIPAAVSMRLPELVPHRYILRCTYAFVAAFMLFKMGVHAHGEPLTRPYSTAMPQAEKLNALTDQERARYYRNVIAQIDRYTADNPLLLIGNQASELFYATETLPFTGNTQMGTFTGSSLFRRLEMQQAYHRRLPVVVYLNGHYDPDVPAYRHDVTEWMQKHQYQKVYEDADLQIFKTKK